MSLLGKKQKSGGFMDEIRCDEPSYLIWKWHPYGSEMNNNKRENAIRWGSSLRVKDGEVAVFVYKQDDDTMQDYIVGPYDEKIETKNLPVLASIIGLAYEGGTPFQAEVYFINLASIIQIPFAVPFFDIYDPRFLDFGVPTAVRGQISFNIADYKGFIKLHRLQNFDLKQFQTQVKDAISRYVKGIVSNVPEEQNIPVVQIERKISLINELVEGKVKEQFSRDFGVNVTRVDINSIEVDKASEGYKQLKSVTQDIATATTQAQAEVNIKNMLDMQRINAENMEETMRIQREETQYAQHIQTESAHMPAFQLEKQAEIGIAGANALGQMGSNGAMDVSGGGGMNPAGMMAGMAMGGAIGQNIAGTMNAAMGGVNATAQPGGVVSPPPIPSSGYNVVINGNAAGPYDVNVLSQMKASGQINTDTLVWKQGMSDWVKAGEVDELLVIFNQPSNEMPPIPPQN